MEPIRHYAPQYLLEPTHPITVNLVGCGGTGSQVLSKLALLHVTLKKLGHPGLHTRVFDPDTIEEPNIGRQLFYEPDIGKYKAIVLVSRVNRAFGTSWESYPNSYNEGFIEEDFLIGANILITCVDTGKARCEIGEIQRKWNNYHTKNRQPYEQSYYWLDFGNSKDTGQVILGTQQEIEQPKSKFQTIGYLPTIIDAFPDISQADNEDDTPSCSTEEALLKQELFTNCMLVPFGMQLLWKLFREAKIEEQGAYINVHKLKSTPIKIKADLL